MFFGCLSTSSLSSSPSASLTSTRGSSSPLSSSPSPLTSTLGSKWRPQLSVCLLALRCGGGSASQRHLCARNSHLHVYFLNDKKEWSLFWNILRTFTTLLSPSYRIFKSLFLRECISAFILCLVPLFYSGAFILTFCTSWRCLAAQIPIFTANTLNLVLAAHIKAHLHIWTFCASQPLF